MSSLNITAGGSYTVNESDLTITIATTEAVTLTGDVNNELTEVVITTTADNANLTIENLNITNASTAIITVGDSTENTLNITGENVFEVAAPSGACVNVGGGLTINGTGSFKGTSISGAVIGINGNQQKPDSNITIESGTFDLTCRSGACAIGGAGARGNSIGNITITGTADITASAPSGHAATIGASYWGSCGDILIDGDAKITATSGQHSAAIGGASLVSVGNITINGNAEVNAINASQVDDSAAIGSGAGSMVQSLGDIVIGGNAKVTASSNLGLAIDNIEYYREYQQYGTTDEGDYYVANENTITIGENATFTGTSGDIYTATTINGEEFKAAQISYNATDGLNYSGGSELNKEDLEATLLDITSGGSYKIDQGSVGKILINTTEAVTLTGGDYDLAEIQIIGQSDNIDLTISDLNVSNKAVSASVIKFGSGADNKLTITGDNDFSVAKGYGAGVNIGGGGTISGTGSLKVLTLNGAAIGTDGQEDLSTSNIVIDSGTFDLETKSGACGLGSAGNGSKIGNITITGTAHVVSKTPQGYAAAIGSIIYVQKSGAHTNVRNLSGNVIYNGDALGVEGDDSYNIEAVSPIDLSEEFPLSGYYITDPHVTAMRLISDGATISPRGDSGSGTVPADWYSFDNAGGTVTFRDGSYCLYPERQFFSRSYTKVDISNNNQGVEITAGDDLIQTIGNLTDGYAITIESGIAVGEKINFETSGNGVILVKTTANTGKYSLAADSDEWQYQNYTINGGGKIQFSDGDHVIFTDTYFPTRNFTTVNADNGGDGFSLNVEEDKFSAISGLNNGYAISVNAGGNISDSLAIHTDGGQGFVSIQSGSVTGSFNVSGDEDFGIKINSDSVEFVDYEGWLAIDGGYQYVSDLANFTISGENFDPNVAKVINNAKFGDSYRVGLAGLNENVTINGVETGVFNDSDYSIHAAISTDGNNATITSLFNISSGASVNGAVTGALIDDNAEVSFADGNFRVGTVKNFSGLKFDTINVDNGGKDFSLTSADGEIKNVSGLVDGYSVSIAPSNSFSDEIEFANDGGAGTIAAGNKTLIADGDDDFAIKIGSTSSIEGLKNFSGAATLLGNETFDSDIALALQRENFSLDTDENYSAATLTNATGDSLNVYYLNATAGGVVDLSNETLTNAALLAQGAEATLIGSQGDDQLIGDAAIIYQTGNAGQDTFRGGTNLESVLITDYKEGEDVVYHGRPFADLSINGSIEGNDYTFYVGNKTITVQDSADKVIEVVNVEGETRLFGKYLTLDDNDPATVTAQDGVATIDAALRTEDIVINGNSGDNTIIGSAGDTTLTGGNGNDLFVYSGGNDVITDYATGDKISLGAAVENSYIDGSDIVITTDDGSLTVQNAKGKTLSLIDSAGKSFSSIIGGESPAQVISDLAGIDVDNLEEITVTNADELAALKDAETSLIEITGNQNVDLSNFDNAQVVSLGSGRQTVKFNDKDDNIAIVDENASGNKNIVFGKGNDLGIFNSENANVRVDLSKASNTTIAPYAGSVTLENYKDSSILVPVEDIAGAVMENAIEFGSDKIKIGSATVKFDSAADSRLIKLVTADGDEQKVAFVKGDALNLGNVRESYLIKGDADSTITAGSGNDTILGGEGNKINAGAGRNEIYLDDNGDSTVILSAGKATVENFNANFDDGDKVSIGATNYNFSYDGEKVNVKSGAGKAVLQNILSEDGVARVLAVIDGKETKTAIAQNGSIIATGDDLADAYYGKKSGVDFSGYSETLNLDLSENFYGINQVTVGSGLNTLSGSSANETLTGNSDGITEYFFGAGGGRDVIQNFNFDEDNINVSDAVTGVRIIGEGNVRLQVGSGDDFLTIQDAQGKAFKVNDVVAVVDKNVTYDEAANYFVATGRNATLTVNEGSEIWLDGSHGKTFVGNIRTLDASNATNKTELAGNDLDNTILAGEGDASLWGGNSGNDLLVGGAGKNTFFYTSGNDTISGTNDGDEIILSDVTLEQISGTSITADGVAINFADGGSLQVNGAADATYQLADGAKFSANHESLSWESK